MNNLPTYQKVIAGGLTAGAFGAVLGLVFLWVVAFAGGVSDEVANAMVATALVPVIGGFLTALVAWMSNDF